MGSSNNGSWSISSEQIITAPLNGFNQISAYKLLAMLFYILHRERSRPRSSNRKPYVPPS